MNEAVICVCCREEYAIHPDDCCDLCHYSLAEGFKALHREVAEYLGLWARFREWEGRAA